MMRRVELQDLLPAGTDSDRSRSEVLQGAGAVAADGAGTLPAAGGGGGGQAGGSSSVADLSSLLQGPAQNVSDQMSALTSQITALSSAQQAQIGAIQDNTQAVTQNST